MNDIDRVDEEKVRLQHVRNREEITFFPRMDTEEEDAPNSIGNFRTAISQILAISIINLILLNLGMILAFPTIAIPALLKSTEGMKFTEEEASWFGSVAFICQPLGSLFSGVLFDPVGRKKTMLYVNIPLFVGWLLIHFSTKIAYLYIGGVIMGIGIGFTDAPHITYLGEITQPKWRGVLTSYAELCIALGFCIVYFLGTTANWRTISVLCSVIPLTALFLITLIPESPIWLLSKGREEDARRSLCWLRGWVQPDAVQQEFERLVRHNNSNKANKERLSASQNEEFRIFKKNKISFKRKFFKLTGLDCIFQRSILHPLFLVVIYFGFSHAAGVTSTRPYMVDILYEFGTPLDANWVTAISSVIGMLGYITGMILLPKTGKRLLSLLSMWGCALTNTSMFIYGFFLNHLNMPLIMVSLFVLQNFIWSFGIGQIPWMLISEVFPFRGRGVASGISAALSYVQAFIFTKTYYSMHNAFTLPGLFGFYGLCTLLGGLHLFYFLPETEGKTLEQIESIVENRINKCPEESVNLNANASS